MQKELITQMVQLWLSISSKADEKGTWIDFQYNLLHFKGQYHFYFFMFVPETLVFQSLGIRWLWSSSRWLGMAPVGLASTAEMHSVHQRQITAMFSLPWPDCGRGPREKLVWIIWPWDTGVMCLYGVCSYTQPQENQCMAWLVTKHRQLEIKYQNQYASWPYMRPNKHQHLTLLNASDFPSSVAPLEITASQTREELEGTSLHYKLLGGTRKQCKAALSNITLLLQSKNIHQM